MATPPQDGLAPLSEVLTESVDAVVTRENLTLLDQLARHGSRCVIFGSGTLGKRATQLLQELGVTPLALCDSNPARWGTGYAGVEVLSPAEAAQRYGADSLFFVTIWNDFHWYRDTAAKLKAMGCRSVSPYAPIFWKFGSRFMDLRLLNEPPHLLYEQKEAVLAAETLWADEESLATYRANIVWRALGDPSYLPFPAPQNTYFPADIFHLIPEESIVDCGAFDGDTIRFVVGLVGSNFSAIYAIEADQVSMAKLDAYSATLPTEIAAKIHRYDCAIGAEHCKLHFSMSGAATSSQTAAEGVEIDCLPMDDLLGDTRVTLIKMDIEGAEHDALVGASKIIARDRPILAVCVYHTQNDIWRLPLMLREQFPFYSFFLRSYDGDGFQTVLYAVPPDRVLPAEQREAAPKPLKAAA